MRPRGGDRPGAARAAMPHFSYENLNLVAGFLGTSKRPPLCNLGTGIGRAPYERPQATRLSSQLCALPPVETDLADAVLPFDLGASQIDLTQILTSRDCRGRDWPAATAWPAARARATDATAHGSALTSCEQFRGRSFLRGL